MKLIANINVAQHMKDVNTERYNDVAAKVSFEPQGKWAARSQPDGVMLSNEKL